MADSWCCKLPLPFNDGHCLWAYIASQHTLCCLALFWCSALGMNHLLSVGWLMQVHWNVMLEFQTNLPHKGWQCCCICCSAFLSLMFEVLHCASSKIQLPDKMWSQTAKSSCFFSKYSRQFKCCKVGHFTSMKTISAKTASSGHSNKFGFWHQFFGLTFPPNAIKLMHTYIKHGHLKNQS